MIETQKNKLLESTENNTLQNSDPSPWRDATSFHNKTNITQNLQKYKACSRLLKYTSGSIPYIACSACWVVAAEN